MAYLCAAPEVIVLTLRMCECENGQGSRGQGRAMGMQQWLARRCQQRQRNADLEHVCPSAKQVLCIGGWMRVSFSQAGALH